MRRFGGVVKVAGLLVGLWTLATPCAQAVVLDLTGVTTEGFINAALFSRTDETGQGSGVFPAFVQIDGEAIEAAYNTTVNNVFDNKTDDPSNHALLLSEIPYIVIDGVAYREFKLDINEPGNDNSFLSLDDIQVFVSGLANQSVETCSGGGACPGLVDLTGTLVYRLDLGGDNRIRLDASLAGGSGHDDMFAYIPDSLFPGAGTQNVYLYSRFGEAGGTDANHGGFEEWGVRRITSPPCQQSRTCGPPPPPPPVIPEPASLLLIGSGLFGAAGLHASSRKLR